MIRIRSLFFFFGVIILGHHDPIDLSSIPTGTHIRNDIYAQFRILCR
jgi:hypothetical protein